MLRVLHDMKAYITFSVGRDDEDRHLITRVREIVNMMQLIHSNVISDAQHKSINRILDCAFSRDDFTNLKSAITARTHERIANARLIDAPRHREILLEDLDGTLRHWHALEDDFRTAMAGARE